MHFRGTYRRGFVVVVSALAGPLSHAQIVPNGSTNSSATYNSAGHATVSIAKPVSNTATSMNGWTQFNVTAAGADIDNRTANARLIVNQVTGGLPSNIEGQVNILGDRANLIIANPAGLWVNGAQFTNVGSLALATGATSAFDFSPGKGLTQRDIQLNVGGGQIQIGPQGLTGAFNSLDLLARSMVVNGPVTNTTTQPHSAVTLIAGATTTRFDSSVSPVDDATQWAYTSVATNPGTAPGPYAVDIGAMGSLTGGKISLIVTDAGAGVRSLGTLGATVGDLQISSTGLLTQTGGSLSAAGNLVVSSANIQMGPASDGTVTTLRSQGDTQLLASTVTLNGVQINAGDSTHTNSSVVIGLPPSLGKMTGSVLLGSNAEGTPGQAVKITATGNLAIFANGQAAKLTGVNFGSQGATSIYADTLVIVGVNNANGSSGYTPSKIISAQNLVDFEVPGSVSITGSTVQGAGGLQMQTGNLTVSGYDTANSVVKSELSSAGGSVELASRGSITMNGTDVIGTTAVIMRAGNDIRLTSDPLDQSKPLQSVVASTNGGVSFQAGGDIVNKGTLIQGQQGFSVNTYLQSPVNGKPVQIAQTDAVNFLASGAIQNTSSNANQLGIVFGVAGNVSLNAEKNITNDTARIISNGTLYIGSSEGDFINQVQYLPDATNGQSISYSGDHQFLGLSLGSSSNWQVNFGQTSIPGQVANTVSQGSTTISARNITNRGGQMNANSGDVTLIASNDINLLGVTTGTASSSRDCILIFCHASASSNVKVLGGDVNASGKVNLQAGHNVTNLGSQVQGIQGVTVTAAQTTGTALQAFLASGVDRGFSYDIGKNWAQIAQGDSGGTFVSQFGGITINGDVIYNGGASIAGGSNPVTVTGKTMTERVRSTPVFSPGPIGLFWGW